MSTFGGILIGGAIGAVAVFASRSKSKKEIDNLKKKEQELQAELERVKKQAQNAAQTTSNSNTQYVPADIAFKENMDLFIPLLDGVTKHEISNRAKWTEIIVSINNDELTELWRAANNRPDLWVTYLQTFGLQMDWVDTFEAAEYHKEMYDDKAGIELQIGKNYKVLSACWILTDENNLKSVAKKGVVSQI